MKTVRRYHPRPVSKRRARHPARPTPTVARVPDEVPVAAPARTYVLSAIPPTVRSASILASAIVAIGLFAYGITLLPKANFVNFDINGYRAKQARSQSQSLRSIIAEKIGADALTPAGVAGWVDYESTSGNLVMSIKNRRGEPVQGANVQAVFTHADGSRGPSVLLQPDATSRYSADVKALGTGPWGVSIVATDPSVATGSQLLFRVEKDIRIQ